MSKDCIQLTVPAKPEYIMITRLTASAVASRIGFDIDTIEDIKIAVAEAAILIMNQEKNVKDINLFFYLEQKELSIEIKAGEALNYNNTHEVSDIENREMSMFIIQSMMDKVDLHTQNGILTEIIMQKNCRSR